MQLHPLENFTITHQLNNPAYITDTAYVRAVIRNAKTDATLATKTLTDKGSGRFTVTYQVPADVSGQGFWISIITTVYSDSGYTTQSQNYGVEANTYLVQARVNTNLGMGGGGGSDINYKKIREIVREEIDKRVDAIEIPKIPEVITVTKEVIVEKLIPQQNFSEIKFPEIKFPSQQPLIDAIKEVAKKVDDKPVTEVPEVNMKPIMESIADVSKVMEKKFEGVDKKLDSMKIEVNFPDAMKLEGKRVKEITSPIQDPRITRLMQKNI